VLRYVALIIALFIGVSFLAEMLRRDGRKNLLLSLAGTITGVVIATGLAGWVAAARSEAGAAIVVAGALALLFAGFITGLSISPGWLAAVITVWVAAGIGVAAGFLVPHATWGAGLIVGTTAGIAVAALRILLSDDRRYKLPRVGAAVSIVPVAVCGILMYAFKWLLLN
jgi:hypothetical protein